MTNIRKPSCPQCGKTQYVVRTSRVEINRQVVKQRWACYYCLRPFDAENVIPDPRRRWLRRALAMVAALSLPVLLMRRRKPGPTGR